MKTNPKSETPHDLPWPIGNSQFSIINVQWQLLLAALACCGFALCATAQTFKAAWHDPNLV